MVEKALDPLGRELTAEEYDLIYGKSYKEDGNFPICKGCDQPLFVVSSISQAIQIHYQHIADAECPSRMQDRISRVLHPRDFDPEHGKRILSDFCETGNLKRAYNTLRNIFQQLSGDQFYLLCKEAHRRRIWRYAGITLESLPYIMAATKDVSCIERTATRSSTYIARSVLHKPRGAGIEWVWERPGSCRLHIHRVAPSLDHPEEDNSPVSIPDKRLETDWATDTRWIDRNPHLLKKIKRFCTEQELCHD